jgi:transcriptional regulator with XRE-family HTH domain
MGKKPVDMSRFREHITRERKRRGLSQAEVARMLTAKGIDNMHHTTVAKIEAGDREIKLDEAVALAQLYEAPLDALVGLHPKSGRDLNFLLRALNDVVTLARTELDRTARSLRHCMEDIPSDHHLYDTLAGFMGDVVGNLDAADEGLDKVLELYLEHSRPVFGMTPMSPYKVRAQGAGRADAQQMNGQDQT